MEQLIYQNKPYLLLAAAAYSFFAVGGSIATVSSAVLACVAAYIVHSRIENKKSITKRKHKAGYMVIK